MDRGAMVLPADLDPDNSGALTAGELRAVAEALARRGAATPAADAGECARRLGAVAESWLDPRTSHRRDADRLLPASTGYAPAMVGEALDRLFASLRAEHLAELLAAEQDVFQRRRPRLVLTIGAGTVFPPSIAGATLALLLGAAVLVKPASATPLLPILWARSLASLAPDLARRLAVLPWPRARDDLTHAALGAADTVLAYGDDASMAALRSAVPPAVRLAAHGHRVSSAILGGPALRGDARRLAAGLARDVSIYDQEGCLSPHTVFVEENPGCSARDFAELLAVELAELARVWPRAPLAPATASSLHQFLLTAELEGGEVRGGMTSGFAVVLDRRSRFEFSPLARTVIVSPVRSIPTAIAALAPVADQLQAIGLAVAAEDRLALARGLGLYDRVSADRDWAPRLRLCPVGTMQSPAITWAADGLRPLASLCPP
jgi:hypothetical protein